MQVIITPKAQKQYKSLPKSEQRKIKKKLQALEENTFSGKKLSGELAQLRSIKAWPYRILYYIDAKAHVTYVAAILHRQGAY